MSRTRVDVEKWKALVSQGGDEAARDLAIAKSVTSEIRVKAADGEGADRVLETVASTAAVDRDKDTVNPAGWQLGNFSKNGPILWAHDASQLPVAKAVKTWIDAVALRCEMQFPTADVYAFADTVYQLAKGGYLNAVSVGFLPTKWVINEERGFFAIDFLEQELLELSIVPIPSNPEALIQARSAGKIDLEPVIEWAEKVLDGAKGAGLWVPVSREKIEHARKAMKGSPTNISLPVGFELVEANGVHSIKAIEGYQIVKSAAGAEGDALPPVSSSAPAGAPEQKRGRTLSAANESKLRTAHTEIGEVLSQVQSAPEEDAAPPVTAKTVEPVVPPVVEPVVPKAPAVVESPKPATVPDALGKMLGDLELMVKAAPAQPAAPAPAPAQVMPFVLDEGRVARSVASIIDSQLFAPLTGRVS